MEPKNSKLLKYAIGTAVAAIAAFAVAYIRGLFEAESTAAALEAICDGFFVIGLLYTGFGAMSLIIHEGVLDITGFGFKSLVYLFTPRKLNREEGGYYEYRERKKAERAEKKPTTHILWIGVAFIVVSAIILLILYLG